MTFVRKVLFWSHLTLGLCAGVVITLMATTGSLLAYERQVRRAEEPLVATSGDVLRPQAVLAGIEERRVSSLTLRADPSRAWTATADDAVLYVDPHTGAVLGESKSDAIFEGIENLHRRLASGDGGKLVTGWSNVAFLVLAVSGTYLWWQRRRTRRVELIYWHYLLGICFATPVLIMTTSATFFSFSSWSKAVSAMGQPGEEAPPLPLEVDAAFDAAVARTPSWQSISFRLPSKKRPKLAVTVLTGEGNRPTHWDNYEAHSTGAKVVAWTRWLHTGEAGGLLGQTTAVATAGSAVFLFISGCMLSIKRYKRRALR